MIQQSISNQTTKQQQQTANFKTQQRIVSPLQRRINTGMNKDKPVIQSQLSVIPTQKPKFLRELEQLQASEQLQQQENNYLNNTNTDKSDILGTVGQLTGLQPSSGAQSLSLNAELKPNQTGLISASSKERIDPQINEGHEDNADEEEDEQTNKATLNQNKDYRVNMISQPPVYENIGTQSQINQGLNALSQIEKEDSGSALVGAQEKLKQKKGSKKSKTEGLNASDEKSQDNNAQAQTKLTSKVPKTKATSNRGKKAAKEVKPDPKNSKEEGEEEHSL